MLCPHCAETIPDDSVFCPECGRAVSPPGSSDARQTQPPHASGTGQPQPATVPLEKSRTGLYVAVAVLGTLVLVFVALIAIGLGEDEGPSTAMSEADEATGSGLAVGDCFPEDLDQLVDCSEPHAYEVYLVTSYDLADDEYPGDDDLFDYAADVCDTAFEMFIGTPYEESELDNELWYPTEDLWAQGDREIVCALYSEEDVTGSLEGSGL